MNAHEIGNFPKLEVTRWTFGDKLIKIHVLEPSTTNLGSLLSFTIDFCQYGRSHMAIICMQ